ncbi:MAG: class I tRNA ligase family protein, partial [Candidatus Shapirobacteria bacterium]|nr:class I tRNA ligase family protein [Candidatus Shapirobacteria bacterium]
MLKYQSDKKYWAEWFPADFITESLPGQFKNWFYSLIAMSTVLENTNSFKTVLGHGMVLGEDGQAMHKSMGNAIEFNEGADKIGVDVMRWMFLAHNPADNLLFGYKTADEVRRRFHLLLWNIYNFFVSYANLEKWQPIKADKNKVVNILDRWIISRLNQLIKEVTKFLEE